MDVGTQTGDKEGRWKRETEEVYPKRTLNFLLALVSVSFIILIIIGIIGLIVKGLTNTFILFIFGLSYDSFAIFYYFGSSRVSLIEI